MHSLSLPLSSFCFVFHHLSPLTLLCFAWQTINSNCKFSSNWKCIFQTKNELVSCQRIATPSTTANTNTLMHNNVTLSDKYLIETQKSPQLCYFAQQTTFQNIHDDRTNYWLFQTLEHFEMNGLSRNSDLFQIH